MTKIQNQNTTDVAAPSSRPGRFSLSSLFDPAPSQVIWKVERLAPRPKESKASGQNPEVQLYYLKAA